RGSLGGRRPTANAGFHLGGQTHQVTWRAAGTDHRFHELKHLVHRNTERGEGRRYAKGESGIVWRAARADKVLHVMIAESGVDRIRTTLHDVASRGRHTAFAQSGHRVAHATGERLHRRDHAVGRYTLGATFDRFFHERIHGQPARRRVRGDLHDRLPHLGRYAAAGPRPGVLCGERSG